MKFCLFSKKRQSERNERPLGKEEKVAKTIFAVKGMRPFIWYQNPTQAPYKMMVWDWDKGELVHDDFYLVELSRPGADWVELTEEQFNQHIQWLKDGRPGPTPDWVW